MKSNHRLPILFLAVLAGLFLGLVEPVFAGPGGIIKEVAMSFWGKVGLSVLAIIFAPLIIWYMAKRHKHIKLVRSDLDRLAALYPQYRWLDVRDRATEIFLWMWSAWSQQKMSIAADFTTHWFWQNQQLILDQWAAENLQNVCRPEKIISITPLYIEHIEEDNGDGSCIVVQIKATVVDYLKNNSTGAIVKGEEKVGDLETIWTLKRQEGEWRLNFIEDGSQEFAYLGLTNKLPSALQAAPQEQTAL